MPAAATALLCLVIGITDGDTLTARCDTADGAQKNFIDIVDLPARRSSSLYKGKKMRACRTPQSCPLSFFT